MKCHRCDGLMFEDTISDLGLRAYVHRCANCGEILDHTIVDNRMKQYRSENERVYF